MATLFTRIIDGEIPGRFVWRDERCVVFLTIAPLQPGHCLVVPVEEVDHWLDLAPDLATYLFGVAQIIGTAQQAAFASRRVGLIIAGLDVPHTHLHVVPMRDESDLVFANADPEPTAAALDDAADRIRHQLRATGHAEVVDA
ncbi:HIT family protein [soil metagenome]